MPNTNTQIIELLAKIAEKKDSKDKLDLLLVKHWESEIIKLKENEETFIKLQKYGI
jgi:hypothetical protein